MSKESITINQAKLSLNNLMIDIFGFDSEPIMNSINNCQTYDDLKNYIQELIKKSNKDESYQIISLWSDLSYKIIK